MPLSFGRHKAPQIVALAMGAEFETRRKIKLPGEPGAWHLYASTRADGWWDERGYAFTSTAGAGIEFRKPRYRPGRVYTLGFPHWRRLLKYRDVWHLSIYCEFTGELRDADFTPDGKLVRPHDPIFGSMTIPCEAREAWLHNLRTVQGFRRMAGRFLPTWAARHWGLVLSAEPQLLHDTTEEQAVAELVERATDLPAAIQWRDYLAGDQYAPFACSTARASYATMIDAVNGPGTWARNEWYWRYRLRLVPKPEGESA